MTFYGVYTAYILHENLDMSYFLGQIYYLKFIAVSELFNLACIKKN